MNKQKDNIHPLVARLVRLRITVLLFVALSIFGGVYFYSSESKQPFIGQPKALNQALLDQEIENASLLFKMDSIVTCFIRKLLNFKQRIQINTSTISN